MSRKTFLCMAVVTAAVVAFLWDILLAGQTFYLRDVIFDALPWRRFAAQELAEGSVPLWNPHSRFGQPFLANPQSAVLYPPHLLFSVLPVAWAFKLNLLLHLLLAGCSMAALLLRYRLHHAAAALGGIVWALGGYMTANLEFMSVMETLAWCPLIVLLATRLTNAASADRPLQTLVRGGALLALAVAVAFLAGQAQPLAFTLLIAAVLVAFEARARGMGGRDAASIAVAMVVAVVAAAGLTAVQWMPTRDLLPLSIRADVDPGLDIASAHPRHLLHLIDPFASGWPGVERWDGGTLFEFWLGSIYIGLLPLVLVPAALTLRRNAGPAAALPGAAGALIFGGLLLALGQHTPVYGLLVDVVPGFGLFRWPAKAFQLVVFGLTVLGAAGLHVVLRERDEGSAKTGAVVALGGVAAVVIAALALAATGTASSRAIGFGVAALLIVLALRARRVPVRAALAAGLALVVVDLYGVSRDIHLVDDAGILDATPGDVPDVGDGRVHTDYTSAQFQLYGSRDPTEYALAVDLLAGDAGLGRGIDRTYGGDALQVAAAREVTDLLDVLPPVQQGCLAEVLGVHAALTGPPFAELRDGGGDARWITLPSGIRRARIVSRWTVEPDATRAMEQLLSPSFDAANSAIVGVPLAAPEAGSAGGRMTAAEFGRERVRVTVDVAGPALLVLADTNLPGWVARVDGQPREIVPTNVIFRGVPLLPGEREVILTYEPPSVRTGLLVTALTTTLLLALLLLKGRA